MRIVDRIGNNNKRRFAAFLGNAEYVRKTDVLDLRCQCGHALMRNAAAEHIQLAPVRVDGRYAAFGRLGDNYGHTALTGAGLNINLVHRPAAFQQLEHRIAPGDNAAGAFRLRLAQRLRAAKIISAAGRSSAAKCIFFPHM